jgi:hypothetical protein
MATLRDKLGEIDVASNVRGTVVIDGRERATLPLVRAVRVLPGTHLVRVLKDGYQTFETKVDVSVRTVRSVDARLEPLSAAGGLRVEDPSLIGGDVLVDGVRVGAAPWEGTLAPGPHVVASRKEGHGSAPTLAVVLQGQTALLRLRSGVLGPAVHIDITPATAMLRIGGVAVGHGAWEGSLPVGTYEVDGREEGYFPKTTEIVVAPAGETTVRAALALAVDETHPRWPKRRAIGHLAFSAAVAGGLSPTLHSGAEARCTDSCDRAPPSAALVLARVGFELRFGLALEVAGGYFAGHAPLHRVLPYPYVDDAGIHTTRFAVDDNVQLHGPFLAPGISFAKEVVPGWSVRTRAGAGVLIATSTDPLTVTASSTTQSGSVPVAVGAAGDQVSSTTFLTLLEAGIERTFGGARVGLGLLGFIAPAGNGPQFSHGSLRTNPVDQCAKAGPGSVWCTPESTVLGGERSYGPFLFVMPQLTVTWLP